MSAEMPKAYVPSDHEDRMYALWEASGCFAPEKLPERHQHAPAYTIAMPPPNRTGIPHQGHAMGMTIQDAYIRFERMRGRKALWIPGTDHAAIATQIKVDKILQEKGYKNPRQELGRERFLEEVVAYSEASGEAIRRLIKKMGCSCDWSRERFTMDEGCNKAVYVMFAQMVEDGLVERGYRIVNWDPQFQTTLSDDEVLTKEVTARLLTFRYAKDFPIVISTTRPETKFGDTAVAVHPTDERYKQYIGQTIQTSFCGKPLSIRVIADEAVDPAFGTGALGVTPAHSMIDATMAETHGLATEVVIGKDGCLLPNCGSEFAGKTVQEARRLLEARLQQDGLLEKAEEIPQNLPISEKGGGPVEQLPMEQWWVRVNRAFTLRQNTLGKWKKGEQATLKELMLAAVDLGHTRIIPEASDRIYHNWINGLQDWCISRQIWYGHQIPVWYRENEWRVSREAPGEGWTQDPDTLDTWFSAGMWTFSILGWPDNASVDAAGNLVKTGDLALFHPTDLLETGRDLIFFWVARMILMSVYALGEVPFKNVYMHGMVLDGEGKKMSKSLGNIVDPFEFIPTLGTDAIRLSLVLGTAPGQDMKFTPAKIETTRNFTNKLWNISRYILSTTTAPAADSAEAIHPVAKTLADSWILLRLSEVTQAVTQLIEGYQLSLATELLREFVWNDVADWYLEITKVEKEKDALLHFLLKRILALLHPLMPFVTEAIWQEAGWEGLLALASWPVPSVGTDERTVVSFHQLRDLVVDGRRLRAEAKLDPAKKLTFCLVGGADTQRLLQENQHWVKRLLQAADIRLVEAIPEGALSTPTGSSLLGIPQQESSEEDRAKIQLELAQAEAYQADLERRLANTEFVAKAPEKVIQDLRQKLAGTQAKVQRLRA